MLCSTPPASANLVGRGSVWLLHVPLLRDQAKVLGVCIALLVVLSSAQTVKVQHIARAKGMASDCCRSATVSG